MARTTWLVDALCPVPLGDTLRGRLVFEAEFTIVQPGLKVPIILGGEDDNVNDL